MAILYVYGDSTSLGRPEVGIGFHDTYHALLAQRNSDIFSVVNLSFGAGTVFDVYNALSRTIDYYSEKSIVILSVGLVDAAPRPIPGFIKKIISRLNMKLRNSIIDFIHHNRNTLLKLKTWNATPIKHFADTYEKILDFLIERDHVSDIYVVNIPPPHSDVLKQSFNADKYTVNYNKVITEIILNKKCKKIHLIDLYSLLHNAILNNEYEEDGLLLNDWHYSKTAHKLLADCIHAKFML